VVNSTNGILVESENIEQLAAAMCQLIDNYDVYNRTQIALAASEKFNYNTVAEQYTDVYENISGIIA
jgi:glycosyltransferase involved in cell wall biosynthesis